MFEVQSVFIACDRIGIRDARKGSIVNPCPSDSGFAVPSCSLYSLGCYQIKVQKREIRQRLSLPTRPVSNIIALDKGIT